MLGDMVVGVDFDNTIAIYDELMHQVALERTLIGPDVPQQKQAIRDAIRLLPGGEIEWQKLQGTIYGPKMAGAQLAEGFLQFVQRCLGVGGRVHIISHKTEFANYDETGTNLRRTALQWMEAQGLFSRNGSGLTENDVYFEATRQQKLDRIAQCKCSSFVDDLDETFIEQGFPNNVERILYAPEGSAASIRQVIVMSSWENVSNHIFSS